MGRETGGARSQTAAIIFLFAKTHFTSLSLLKQREFYYPTSPFSPSVWRSYWWCPAQLTVFIQGLDCGAQGVSQCDLKAVVTFEFSPHETNTRLSCACFCFNEWLHSFQDSHQSGKRPCAETTPLRKYPGFSAHRLVKIWRGVFSCWGSVYKSKLSLLLWGGKN